MSRAVLLIAIFLAACGPSAPADPAVPAVEVLQEETIAPTAQPPVEISPVSSLPAGPISMVALGDSLTQGDGDDSGRGYPGRLLDKVNTVRPGSTITNLGQSGWNSDALINGDLGLESQLDRAVVELQNATSQERGAVAFVWIGSNDLWYLYEYGGDGSDEGDLQDAEHFAANIDLILKRLRETGAAVIIALVDDQSQRPVALKGEAFTSITQDELARMSAQAARYNEIIVSKAGQYGALTVDFYHTDIFTNPATLYDDGNHPNAAGYDMVAQKWWEVLSTLLGQ
jgi:lysophospholipase L1-like esterase